MIEPIPTATDDPGFLDVVASAVDGLAAADECRALHLIHIDNWFDHKWLQFAGKALGAIGTWREGEYLTVPPFSPNRVLSHRYFTRDEGSSEMQEEPPPNPLHLKVGGDVSQRRRLSDVAPDATLVWYTSNTGQNGKGGIMVYVPVRSGYDTWYVSLAPKPAWTVTQAKQTTRARFESLAQRPQHG